jgi:hypothetical protein
MSATITEKVSLQFTDLLGNKTGCTKKGSNKFWTGWVEKCADGTHSFECRWGPTGTPGSDKGSKRNVSESVASSTLRKKVTGKLKKGYTQLATRSIAEEVTKAAAQGVDLTGGKAKAAPKTRKVVSARTFHREVERLLGVVYNETSKAVRRGLSTQAGSTEQNPSGNLSDAQLDLGGGILDEIADLLKSEIGLQSKANKATPVLLDRARMPDRRIVNLTDRFLSNVPRAIPSAHRGPRNLHHIVVNSYERLEGQRKFLQLLRDAHLAQATFQAAAAAGPAPSSKVGVWYDGLGCNIEFCEPGSADFRKVNDIFRTGQSRKNANFYGSGVRLVQVWKLCRNGTESAYNAYKAGVLAKRGATGEIYGWHGTRTENLLGIGKSGLLMPENLPRGVHISGKAFGRGIYHAPAWTATNTTRVGRYNTDGTNGAFKSLNYTSMRGAHYGRSNSASGAFMFLQNIALGKAEVHRSACWDKRRPDNFPATDWIYANADQGNYLAHDEIVTFDEAAQKFEYLCEFSA